MSKYAVVIWPAPISGYRWKIVANRQTIKEGETTTEIAARTAADAEVKALEKAEGPP